MDGAWEEIKVQSKERKHQWDRETDNEGVLSGVWKLESKNGIKNIAIPTVYQGKMILF